MKVYVASSLKNAPAARALMARFTEAGSEVTFDWTQEKLSSLSASAIAGFEIDAVRVADLLVMLCPAGRREHVEMGVAIALGKKVIIVGAERPIAFYAHRSVMNVATADDLFQEPT